MARPKREGPPKQAVMVRLEPQVFRLAKAVRDITDQSFQELFEPVLTAWLRNQWSTDPAVVMALQAKQLHEATSREEVIALRPEQAPTDEAG